ncbi:hypothetical protein [Actinomadura sp. WMMA1423]|uniref:hypothetical protein n=1 Tax=Actinomadura sp. WMMA1423 TaxID=2591108 RepID=UPI001146A5BB|nr:hypothetical protein [Actinomadura sp. WMMA1423]
MADFEFNIVKGRMAYYAALPAANDALIAVLLKSSGLEADGALKDYDNLSVLLAGTTDEATFTNYARKTLTSVTATVDDTNDRVDVDADDLSWATAGGASNNTLGKLLICYDPDTTGGTDADLIPLTAHDISVTTDGTTLNIAFPSGGFYRAT